MEIILREIINNQNAQIQRMRAILEEKNYPRDNDCKVSIGSESQRESGGSLRKTFISTSIATIFTMLSW